MLSPNTDDESFEDAVSSPPARLSSSSSRTSAARLSGIPTSSATSRRMTSTIAATPVPSGPSLVGSVRPARASLSPVVKTEVVDSQAGPGPSAAEPQMQPPATPSRHAGMTPGKRYSTTPRRASVAPQIQETAGGLAAPAPELPTAPTPVKEEPKGPVPRLIMTKMVLINFKSYAGRIEIGPFHQVRIFCCFRPQDQN